MNPALFGDKKVFTRNTVVKKSGVKRLRLDALLRERGLADTTRHAFIIVTEGRVFLNGQKAVSPAQMARSDAKIEVRSERKYVGRGAEKLEGAIQKFCAAVSGKVCADIGAATGGFTQVLLRHGAKKVYAIDTARGKLALKLRNDPRVIVMEETDARDLKHLPETPGLVVIDVSLISLTGILPHVARLLSPNGTVVALFKPQYETGDPALLRHGIVKDGGIREKLLSDFQKWLAAHHWRVLGQMESPIKGNKGNTEYLFYLCPH